MILVLGRWNSTSRDGFDRRVAAIDQAFRDLPRSYVWFSGRWSFNKILPGLERSGQQDELFRCELSSWNILHFFYFLALVVRSRLVYVHSAYALANFPTRLWLSWLWDIFPRPIVWDVHGAVSDERLELGANDSEIYVDREKCLAERCRSWVAVSETMRNLWLERYPALGSKKCFLIRAIPDAMMDLSLHSTQRENRLVYVGGAQAWQLPLEIARSARSLPNQWLLHIYSRDDSAFRDHVRKEGLAEKTIIEMLDGPELSEALRKAQAGLLLRHLTVVNRVSSPTKLWEYIANGVIPVVLDRHVAGVDSLGIEALSLSALADLGVNNDVEFERMRDHNSKTFLRLRGEWVREIQNLREHLGA